MATGNVCIILALKTGPTDYFVDPKLETVVCKVAHDANSILDTYNAISLLHIFRKWQATSIAPH